MNFRYQSHLRNFLHEIWACHTHLDRFKLSTKVFSIKLSHLPSQSFLSAIIVTKYYHRSRNSDIYCLELVTKLSNELVVFSDIVFYCCNNYNNCYLYIRESVSSRITITVTLQAFRYCVFYSQLELWYYTLYSQTNCHSYQLIVHQMFRHRDDLSAVC